MGSTVIVEKKEAVEIIRINRPEKLNAMDPQTRADLISSIEDATSNQDVGTIVLTGVGEKSFTVGADLRGWDDLTSSKSRLDRYRKGSEEFDELFRTILKTRVPVISSVKGYALGAGLIILLVSDFVVAAENSKFGLPEIDYGFPSITEAALLRLRMMSEQVNEIVLLGHRFGAEEARRFGLVRELLPLDQLDQFVMTMANELSSKPATAVRAVLEWTRKEKEAAMQEGFEFAMKQVDFEMVDEIGRRMAAFWEKRKMSQNVKSVQERNKDC